jgi:hypothetical protein
MSAFEAVPEPRTTELLAVGAAALFVMRGLRRRNSPG